MAAFFGSPPVLDDGDAIVNRLIEAELELSDVGVVLYLVRRVRCSCSEVDEVVKMRLRNRNMIRTFKDLRESKIHNYPLDIATDWLLSRLVRYSLPGSTAKTPPL